MESTKEKDRERRGNGERGMRRIRSVGRKRRRRKKCLDGKMGERKR